MMQTSMEHAKASIVGVIGNACGYVPDADRRELLCEIQAHVTKCIANIDEAETLFSTGGTQNADPPVPSM